jgi:stress response protein YsnF
VAFEQLKELGERAAARVHQMRHSSQPERDPNDPFGRPEVIEVELFEDEPIVYRETVARERVVLGVDSVIESELVSDVRRVEHVEVEATRGHHEQAH